MILQYASCKVEVRETVHVVFFFFFQRWVPVNGKVAILLPLKLIHPIRCGETTIVTESPANYQPLGLR